MAEYKLGGAIPTGVSRMKKKAYGAKGEKDVAKIVDISRKLKPINKSKNMDYKFGKDLDKKLAEYLKNLKAKRPGLKFGKDIEKKLENFKMPSMNKGKDLKKGKEMAKKHKNKGMAMKKAKELIKNMKK